MCCEEVLAREQPLRLDGGRTTVHLDLPPEPRSPATARTFVREALRELGDGEVVEALVLLTSEVVTNAVLHARTDLQIGVTVGDDRVLVSVGDKDLLQPEQQPYGPERTEGRGMQLVDQLAADWGVTKCGEGKSVWFTIPKDGARTNPREAS